MDRERWTVAVVAVTIGAAALVAPWLQQRTLKIAIHQGVEGVALKNLARAFSVDHRVAVEVFELPYAALYDSEMEEVQNARPKYDVIMVDDPWLPALIGEDRIDGPATRVERLALTSRECTALAVEDFVPSTLTVSVHPDDEKSPRHTRAGQASFSCDRPDVFYALPFVGNSQLFVTRDGLRPRGWSEVLATTLERATIDSGYVARVGAGNSIVTDFLPILWTLPPDPPVLPASGDARTELERLFDLVPGQGRAAFRFVRSLGAHKRAKRGVVSVDDFDLTINLVKGNASMTIAWSAWVMAIAKLPAPYNTRYLGGDDRDGELAVTQVPGGIPVLGAWLLAMPAQSGRKDLAREFLAFATDPEQIAAAAQDGNPPPRASTYDDEKLTRTYRWFGEQRTSLINARPRPRTPDWRRIESVLGDCLTSLYENAIDEGAASRGVEAGLRTIRAATTAGDSLCQPLEPEIDEIRRAR